MPLPYMPNLEVMPTVLGMYRKDHTQKLAEVVLETLSVQPDL